MNVIDLIPYKRLDVRLQRFRQELAEEKSYNAALNVQRALRELKAVVKENRDKFTVLDGHAALLNALWNDSMRDEDEA